MPFTPEELAAMAEADEEIDEGFELSDEEASYGNQLDWEARTSRLDPRQQKMAVRRRARYLANQKEDLQKLKDWCRLNPDRVAAAKQAWMEAHQLELKEYWVRYYQTYREEILAKGKIYRESHKDEIRARRKARYPLIREANLKRAKDWYEANKDTKVAAYQEANRDRILSRKKEYREAHKDEIRAQQKAYREAHGDELRAKQKAYREAHKEEIRARNRAYQEAHKDELNAKRRERRAKKKAEQAEQEGECK